MLEQFFQAVAEQLKTPNVDFEKNMRAWFSDTLDRLDIVSRDTLLRQEKQLNDARQAIKKLEQQLSTLEQTLIHGQVAPTDKHTISE